MPSDDRVAAALRALAPRLAAFRSEVTAALEHARSVLASNGGAATVARELGPLGQRIDASRLAALARGGPALDALGRARVGRAIETLTSILESPPEAYVADVRPGASVALVARAALARAGRAFGLGGVADLVRVDAYTPAVHDGVYDAWPVEWWAARARRAAPPVVLTVDGADLRVGDLADLLDGALHIVLVVRGRAAPARLARAITPRVYVAQTRETHDLDALTRIEGPAIVGLFESDVATFTHDPRGGRSLWQRLSITHRPDAAPRKRVGVLSPEQQMDELRHLETLAARPSLATDEIERLVPPGAGEPADRLAAWLLAESGAAGPS